MTTNQDTDETTDANDTTDSAETDGPKTILVAATEESSGKTAIALALGKLAQDRGQTVGYMKPKGTRLESSTGKTLDTDPILAQEVLGIDADIATLEPVVYSPTFVEGAIRRQDDPDDLQDSIRTSFDSLSADRDLMIVEGGGTLTTGGIVDLTDPAIAALLDAEVLLVVSYTQPRDLDGVLGAVDTIGEQLAGVIFNRVPDSVYDSLESDVVPFLESRGVPVLGVIPRVAELSGLTVAQLASELGAEVVTDAPTDELVERFLVGAMGPDEALRHFRRAHAAAVVTGGDRSEIHTAALEAPGVKCLVLTGGLHPPAAVLGRAEERNVPILVVQSDTLSTVERLDAIIGGGRTRDETTVERMQELLFEYANVEELLDEA